MCCILIRNPFCIIIIKVIFICFLSFIPWPIPPGAVTIRCSRDNSRVVRKIVQSKLSPIFQKYHVELPLECPFHPSRDLFAPQENAKVKHRPTQWTCGFCGKSFYEEKFLDLHFDNRHRTRVNQAEDAVCLADYCDIMRCDVLVAKDASLGGFSQSSVSTDIELYNEATALAAARREVIKSQMKSKAFNLPPSLRDKLNDILAATGHKIEAPPSKEKIHKRKRHICNEKTKKSETSQTQNDSKKSDEEGDDDKNAPCESMADRKQHRISEMQRLKSNCKTEEIHKLKSRCERLIRTCIAGALIKLSIEDFRSMEDEMNKAICWYLTCDRYWEDASAQRPFPWALVFILVVVLSLGICLCYYIIWVLFDTDESLTPSYNLLTAHSSHHPPPQLPMGQMPLQTTAITSSSSIPHGMSSNLYQPTVMQTGSTSGLVQSLSHTQPLEQLAYTEEFFPPTAGIDEQYIYVTYPTEMKKRLSDSHDLPLAGSVALPGDWGVSSTCLTTFQKSTNIKSSKSSR